MRDIKFRCWYGERMWYAIPKIQFRESGIHNIHLNSDPEDFCDASDTWTGSDEYHLMQYTGLKDKNGVEIYEGDVVKGDWGDIKEVRFGIEENFVYWHMEYGREGKDYKVIGNIHENPELLENNYEL